MNRLSKIFLGIIIFLVIALGVMIYYYFYWREAYLSTANGMVEMAQRLEVLSEKDTRSEEKVTIEVVKDSVSSSGVTLLITDHNETQYNWGESYKIKIKENDSWKEVQPIKDVSFNELAYLVDENGQITQKINWSQFYGTLSKGTYCIEKSIYTPLKYIVFDSDEFEIK